MTRRFLLATALFAAAFSQTGEAYLRLSAVVDARRVFLQSSTPTMRYFVNETGVPGVSAAQLQTTLARASETWQSVPTSAVSLQFAGTTGSSPGSFDGQNTIGFVSDPDLEDILGLTFLIFDGVTGNIVDVDIMFNSFHSFSVDPDGEEDRFDLESLAVHELGHMFGLDHSGLAQLAGGGVVAAETVMFPLSFDPGTIAGRRLKADDIAGASVIYPDGGFPADTGTISGRVQLTGRPIFGAHVMAFHPGSGTMIAGSTLEDGGFLISGLPPGFHILRVEPIDDGDPSSFFDETIDVAFKSLFFNRLVPVQRGVTTPRIDVAVEPR